MEFNAYQTEALKTDRNPMGTLAEDLRTPDRSQVIPILGLAGEVGTLLGEYKKLLRDGAVHRKFRDEVAEELGDILWYVANVAGKFDLRLDDIAEANLRKIKGRWSSNGASIHFYDEDRPVDQQLPRQFAYQFSLEIIKGITKVVVVDASNGKIVGDPLTSNAYDEDGYRFHDVLHLGLAVRLGWSPVLRKLLRKRRKAVNREPAIVDEVEDGGRAQVVEEAVVAAAYVYAADHDFLEGIEYLDHDLLKHVKRMTAGLEVQDRTLREWNEAFIRGFAIWRQLRANAGGLVGGDLLSGELTYRAVARLSGS
jgi:NTP pyrophosphatase (non-canonical NTP hydrolase)